MDRVSTALVLIIIIAVAAFGIFLDIPESSDDSNIPNYTIKVVINNTTSPNNTTNNTTIISASRAKEIANQFIGMGVYLGSVKLAKLNQTLVWNISIYTTQCLYVKPIYIDAKTGRKIINPDEATQIAEQSTGLGVYLGTPTLRVVNKIQVWEVPVYTIQGKYVDSFYINAHTGEKIK